MYFQRMMNSLVWHKPDPPPNALHTTFTHAHETLLWASKGKEHTFNYDLINSPDPTVQMSSIWRIPTVPKREKLHGYHPTQKPLRLVRRWSPHGEVLWSLIHSAGRGRVGSEGTRTFSLWGAELEEVFAQLAERRIRVTVGGIRLCQTPTQGASRPNRVAPSPAAGRIDHGDTAVRT